LRSRADSMCPFESLEQVALSLDNLIATGLVAQLPRQPGQKEQRFAHLLAGDAPSLEPMAAPPQPAMLSRTQPDDRLAALEQTVALLREELEQLRNDFLALKHSIE